MQQVANFGWCSRRSISARDFGNSPVNFILRCANAFGMFAQRIRIILEICLILRRMKNISHRLAAAI